MTTTTPDNQPALTPAPATGRTWFYWMVYVFPGGTSAAEIFLKDPITRGAQVIEISAAVALQTGHPYVVFTSWTLLRVEDADGQVIG
jgi:hypothetical protein